MSQSLRLLLVESDDDLAFLMRKSLEKAGHQVATCDTAAAALLALRQGNFSLITLNQVLPDASGLDLLQMLRREGVKTPAIMVTGRDDPALVSRALRAGALDFLAMDRALAFLAELPGRVANAARASNGVAAIKRQEFWFKKVRSQPLTGRLGFIESQFPGSYGCGWEEGVFYALPAEDAAILQSLWEETYRELHGEQPEPNDGPAKSTRSRGG